MIVNLIHSPIRSSMGEHFDQIPDPELKRAIEWWAKNTYLDEILVMLGQIEAEGDRTKLIEYAKHESEFIENACESLAVTGNHPAILKAYQARDTEEARETRRKREKTMEEIGKLRRHPDYHKGSGWGMRLKHFPDEPGSGRAR